MNCKIEMPKYQIHVADLSSISPQILIDIRREIHSPKMLHTLNVGEQISVDRESHIDDDSTYAQERAMEDHTATSLLTFDANEHLLCQVATGAAADTSSVQNDGCWLNIFDIGQVMVRRLNVSIAMLFTWREGPSFHFVGDVGQTVARVVVCHDIYLQ